MSKNKQMTDWFTIDQIDKESYIISEYRHPEETHCYLLNGSEHSLLIDTGLGICNIYDDVGGSDLPTIKGKVQRSVYEGQDRLDLDNKEGLV